MSRKQKDDRRPRRKRPRNKIISALLAIGMLTLGILCFFVPPRILAGIQYAVFGCVTLYGGALIAQFARGQNKSKLSLVIGVACALLGLAVIIVWAFMSGDHAVDLMTFATAVVLAVISVTMGIRHLTTDFVLWKVRNRCRAWMLAAGLLNIGAGIFLVAFPLLAFLPPLAVLLEVFLLSAGLAVLPELWAPSPDKDGDLLLVNND